MYLPGFLHRRPCYRVATRRIYDRFCCHFHCAHRHRFLLLSAVLSSANRCPPSSHETRMTPGELHVRVAEANLAMPCCASSVSHPRLIVMRQTPALQWALHLRAPRRHSERSTTPTPPPLPPPSLSRASFHVGVPLRLDAAQSQLARLQ